MARSRSRSTRQGEVNMEMDWGLLVITIVLTVLFWLTGGFEDMSEGE